MNTTSLVYCLVLCDHVHWLFAPLPGYVFLSFPRCYIEDAEKPCTGSNRRGEAHFTADPPGIRSPLKSFSSNLMLIRDLHGNTQTGQAGNHCKQATMRNVNENWNSMVNPLCGDDHNLLFGILYSHAPPLLKAVGKTTGYKWIQCSTDALLSLRK